MLNETASNEASFCISQKSLSYVCSTQKSSSSGETSGMIDMVNFMPDPPNGVLVDYASSEESGGEQDFPPSDADGAVFDLGAKIDDDNETPRETKLLEKKEF